MKHSEKSSKCPILNRMLIQVNVSGWARFFLGLAGLLLGISLGLRPREIPRSSSASPWKSPSIPPLLLGLTHYISIYKHCAMLYTTAPYGTTLFLTAKHFFIQNKNVPYSTIRFHATLHITVQYCIKLFDSAQSCSIPHTTDVYLTTLLQN